MKKTKILLVEDDELAASLIDEYLRGCGFDVECVTSAIDGVSYLKCKDYDLLILDINLPDFDGFELLKSIKNQVSLPIIVTSAHSDTESKLLAFKYGASDYMTKPLDLEELEARIWVQLSKTSEIKLQKEKNIFEIKNSIIFFQDKLLDLTTIEFEILSILIENKNQTISREDLLGSLSSISSNRSLDNHIKNIRKKIGDNGSKATYLKTEYGVGYSLRV
jgi:DNA-binding response OmpR family regulator